MTKSSTGFVMAAVGLVVGVVSLLADVIGLGEDPGFGVRQTTGTIVGFVLLVIGIWLWKQSPPEEEP